MPGDTLYDSARRQATPQPLVRERLAGEGPQALSDAELLAALLGTAMRGKGAHELAEEVLGLLDSSKEVPDAEMLARLAGMGGAKAGAVCAALDLGRRLSGVRDKRIASPGDVWTVVSPYAARKRGRFIRLSLNGAHELIAARVVSVGLVNWSVVHPFFDTYHFGLVQCYLPSVAGTGRLPTALSSSTARNSSPRGHPRAV